MSTIYLTEVDSVVRISSRHLVVTKGKEKLLQMPLIKVDRLLLFGKIQITAQTVSALLDEGIEVCYLSSRGKFGSKIQPAESKNVLLRVAQYERFLDDTFQVEVARTIGAGKINNGRALILRYQRNYPKVDFSQELRLIETTLNKLPSQTTVDNILGSEGIATAAYFRAYGKMFCKEFHHPFIDRFTLSLFNNDVLAARDFEAVENQGVYLTTEAHKRYFEHYERRIRKPVTLVQTEEEVNFRQLFKTQVHKMSQTILTKKPYQPFRIYY